MTDRARPSIQNTRTALLKDGRRRHLADNIHPDHLPTALEPPL